MNLWKARTEAGVPVAASLYVYTFKIIADLNILNISQIDFV
jgi:hypothetical protein